RAVSPVPQPASRTEPVIRSATSMKALCGLPISHGAWPAYRVSKVAFEHLFGSDPAVLHLDESIGRVGNARIVGHHQNRAALVARQLDKQFDDFAARFAVQR